MITTDIWDYTGNQYKTIEVIGGLIHQGWDHFDQDSRVGYKVYLPDGTVIYPETMISSDVWSGYVNSSVVDSDSVVITWREGSPAYYTVREGDGSEAIPTTLYLPEPWANYPQVHSSCDSLGRIHSVFTLWDGSESRIGYMLYEPGVGEIWRDTVPGSHSHPRILVDGNRVHIVFRGEDLWPDYIQYDLNGNTTIPPVSLIEDLIQMSNTYSIAIDSDRNLYCFFGLYTTYVHLSLFKIDGMTGEVLISDKEIHDPPYSSSSPTILTGYDDETMYLLWIEAAQDYPRHVKFAVIDKNGDFIVDPYSAYDYTDEEIQNLSILDAAGNGEGDIFAIWSQGDVEVGGYWTVMGWFDHDSLGIEEESTIPVNYGDLKIRASSNPFSESVEITVTADPLPVHMEVYDLSGRMVRTLNSAGDGIFFWDGCDTDGNEVPSGNYVIRGSSGDASGALSVIKL